MHKPTKTGKPAEVVMGPNSSRWRPITTLRSGKTTSLLNGILFSVLVVFFSGVFSYTRAISFTRVGTGAFTRVGTGVGGGASTGNGIGTSRLDSYGSTGVFSGRDGLNGGSNGGANGKAKLAEPSTTITRGKVATANGGKVARADSSKKTSSNSGKVYASTSSTLNFQARLTSSTGNIVPDGNYNIEFKLYNALTSSGSTQGTCTGDANCLWTENYTGASKVKVQNGYLSVYLGTQTALPTNISWDQNMYITMNIGGSGAATWDGEMTPRIQLSAVPYALASGQIAKFNGTQTGTLSFSTVANSPTIQLPDIAGTNNVLLQSGTTLFSQGSVPFTDSTGRLTQSNANLFFDGTNNTLGIGSTRTGAIDGTGNSRLIIQGSGSTSATSSLNIRNSSGSGSLFLVRDDGNVGIGTTTPSFKLDVQGNTINLDSGSGSNNAVLRLVGRSAGTASIATINANYNGGLVLNPAIADPTVTIGASSPVNGNTLSVVGKLAVGSTFYTTAAPSNGAIIEGNVGIGTTNPTGSKLVVQSTGSLAYFQSTGANSAQVYVDNAAGGQQSAINFNDASITKYQIGKQTDNSFFLYSNDQARSLIKSSSTGADLYLQQSGGNVGIGTIAPTARLQTLGAAATSGTGTIASSSTTITGTGTSFSTQLHIGDTITASGQTKTVSAIASNTSLTTGAAFSPVIAGGTTFSFAQPTARITNSTDQIGLVVQGVAGQTANLFEIQDSTGAALAGLNSLGNNLFSSNALSVGSTSTLGASHFSVKSGASAVPNTVLSGASGQTGDLLQFQDFNGNINSKFGALGNQLTLGRVAAAGTVTQGSLLFADGTTDNFTATLQASTQTANTIFQLPAAAAGTYQVCTTASVCAGYGTASGSFVNLAPSSAQVDSSTNSSIFINKTGASGKLLQLQVNGAIRYEVNNGGDIYTSGCLGFNLVCGSAKIDVSTASIGTRINQTSTNDILQLQSGGTTVAVVNSAGSLGVGTATPTSTLQAQGAAGVSSGATTMTAANAATTFTTSVSTTLNAGDYIIPTTSTGQARSVVTTATGTTFTVSPVFSAGVTAETFTIHRSVTNLTNSAGTSALFVQGSTGRVGIGTVAPITALQVTGNISVTNGPVLSTSGADGLIRPFAGGKIIISQQAGQDQVSLAVKSALAGQTADTLQVQDVNGNVSSRFSGNGSQLTLGNNTASGTTQGKLLLTDGTSDGFTATLQASTQTANTIFELPAAAAGTYAVCTTASVCSGYASSATNGYVQFAPTSAQADATTNSSIFINKTGASGNILQLQSAGVDRFVVSNAGQLQLSGAASNTKLISAKITGDTNDRFALTADGYLTFGDGAGSSVNLYRSGVNVLRTDNALYIGANNQVVGQFFTNNIAAIGNAPVTGQQLTVISQAASNKVVVAKGAASQTGDLIQAQDVNGAVLSGTNSSGGLFSYGTNNTFGNLATPAFTTASTGTSFYYVITATNTVGETVASVSLGMANNTSALAWTQVNGATGYKIYRNTSNAFTTGSLLLTTITNGTTVSYTDTASATAAGLPPTAPTGTKLIVQAWEGQVSSNNVFEVKTSVGSNALSANAFGNVIVGGGAPVGAVKLFVGPTANIGLQINEVGSNDILQLQNNAVNVLTVNSNGNLTLGNDTASPTAGQLILNDSTGSNGFTATLQANTQTANTIFQLPGAAAGTYQVCTTASICSGYASTPATGNFLQQVPTNTADNTVTPTANSVVGLTINGTTGTAATALSVVQGGNATALNVAGSGTGNLAVLDTTNATANGVSVDLQSASSSQYALNVTANNGATNLIYARADGNVGIGTTSPTAKLQINTATNTATAFQVQNAASAPVLTVDTTNSQLKVQGINSTASIGGELLTGNCTGTNWSGTGVGPYTHTSGSSVALTCTITGNVTSGATYQVSFDSTPSGAAATNITPAIGGVSGPKATGTVTTFVTTITTTSTANPTFTPNVTTDTGTISNISFKLVTLSNNVLVVQNSDASAGIELRAGGIGLNNSFIGVSSGQANTTGANNTAVGYQALQANTTVSGLTAIGYQALQNNTTGTNNTATGYQALKSNTTGLNNTANGFNSLSLNTTGFNNTATGSNTLQKNTTGYSNTATGTTALYLNTTGFGNTANGYLSLYSNTSGTFNTGNGYGTLQSNTTGNRNTALGYNAGNFDPTVTSFVSGTTLQNATTLGFGSQVQASNSLILGGQGLNAVNVGIGTTIPTNTLSVSPDQYDTGTVTRTNGSTALVGTGTTWTSAMVGSEIIFADGYKSTVATFTDATNITMAANYGPATDASPVSYRIHYIGLQVTNAGNVGVGTTSPGNKLSVNTLTTPASASGYQLAVSTGGVNNGGIVIQGVASQTATNRALQIQNSIGTETAAIDTTGTFYTISGFQINNSSSTAGFIVKVAEVDTGGTVNQYDVVIYTSTGGANTKVLTTTTARDSRVYGVVIPGGPYTAGQFLSVALGGNGQVNVDTGAVAVGDQLVVSATAGRATADNNATTGIVGIATTSKAAGSNGTVGLIVRPVGGATNPNFGGNVGINTQGTAPTNRLSVNASTTADSLAQVLVSTNGVNNKGLAVQGIASQSADLLQLQDSAGNVNTAFNSTGNQLTLGRVAATGTVTQGKLLLADGTNSNFSATLQATTQTANTIFQLPAAAAGTYSVCTSANNCSGLAANINNTTTVQTNANFALQSAADASITGLIRARASQTADLLQFQNSAGTQPLSGINSSGQIYFRDSTSGFTSTISVTPGSLAASNKIVTLPNAGGELCTSSGNCIGNGGSGDVFKNGQTGPLVLGTNDAGGSNLSFITQNITRATFDFANNLYLGNGATAATPNNFVLQGTGSSTVGTAGALFSIKGGAGATATTGSAGGGLTLQGGDAGGSAANNGGDVLINGGAKTSTGTVGNIILQGSNGGNVGIGTSAPTSTLQVARTSTATSGTNINIFGSITANPGSAPVAGTSYRAANFQGIIGANSQDLSNATVYGLLGQTSTAHTSTGALALANSIALSTNVSNTSTGRITNAVGVSTLVGNSSTGTIDNAYGVSIGTNLNSEGGTITNNYGLYVSPQTAGATNYALFTSGTAQSSFGGNVGIGTIAPSAQLHVVGANGTSAGTGTVGTAGLTVTGGAGGNSSTAATAGAVGGGITLTSGAGGNSTGVAGTNGANISLQGGAGGTGSTAGSYGNLLLQTSGGNVGIGTAAPSSKLQISDGNAVNAALLTTDLVTITAQGTAPGFSIVSAGTTIGQRAVFKGVRSNGTLASPTAPNIDDNVVSLLGAIYDGTTTQGTAAVTLSVDGTVSAGVAPQRIGFFTSVTDGANRIERLTVKASGNVGIGTIAPSAQLHVVGANGTSAGTGTAGTAGLTVSGGAGGNSSTAATAGAAGGAISLTSGAGGNSTGVAGTNGANISLQGGAGGTGTTTGSYGNLLLQTSGGNVGIGTAAPATQLHINNASSNATLRLTSNTNNLNISSITNGDASITGYTGGLYFGNYSTTSSTRVLANGSFAIYNSAGALPFEVNTAANTVAVAGNASFIQSGTGVFGTGTGAVSLNGDTTLATGKSLTLASGTGTYTQTYTGTGNALSVVSSSTTNLNKGLSVTKTGANVGTDYAGYFSSTGTGATNVGLYSTASGASSNIAAIFDQGSVGIGTTAPATTLEVSSASDTNISISSTAASANTGLYLNSKLSGVVKQARLYADYYGGLVLLPNSGRVSINTTDNTFGNNLTVNGNTAIGNGYTQTAAPANGLLVQGNVGIGTSSPGAQLHVVGTAGVSGGTGTAGTAGLTVTGGAGGNSSTASTAGAVGGAITLTSGAGGNSTGVAGTNGANISLQGGAGGTGTTAGSYGNIVLQQSGGNVGIGTSAPSTKLQIGNNTADASNILIFGAQTAASQSFLPTIQQASIISAGVSQDLALGARSNSGGIVLYTGNDASQTGALGLGGNAARIVVDAVGSVGIGGAITPSNFAGANLYVSSGGNVGIGTTTPTSALSFGGDVARTIKLEANTTNAAGNNLTISAGAAGAGAAAFTGGTLTLQGGAAAGTGNANGANVSILGGAGVGTGIQGLVALSSSSFTASATETSAITFTLAQSKVDNNSTIPVNATAASLTVTVPAPTQNVVGRILYITAVNGSNTFTLAPSGGTSFTMNANTTATLVWNGTVWTNAGVDGGSSSYIQNQNGSNQTATFRINGVGQAAGFDINATGTLNIGAGTTAGQLATAIQLGNDANNSALTLSSGTGAINIGTGAQARAVNIATGAAAQALTLGSTNTTSTTAINGGTGATAVTINTGSGGTLSLGNSGVANTIQVGNTTGAFLQTISLGTNATASSTNTINIGNAATSTTNLNLGSTSANTTTQLQGNTVSIIGGTGASAVGINVGAAGTLSIGTTAVAQTINIGSTTAGTGIVERVGTGNYSLDGVAGSTYTFGASTTTGTIAIGGTAQTGTLTLGSSTGTQSVLIGNGTGASTVSIGNASTAGLSTVNIANATTAGSTVNIAGAATATAQTDTVNIATGNSAGTGAKVVHIADGTPAGTGINGVTIGTVTNASTTTIRGGTGSTALALQSGSGGTITIGATAASTVNVGTGAFTHTIAIGNDGTTTQGITIGSTSASSTTLIQGGTGASAISLQAGVGGTVSVGASAGSGSTLLNNGSTVNAVLAKTDFNYTGSGNTGSIGSAATTVDIYTAVSIAQTTAGQTLTIPTPTASTTYGRLLYISNIGTTSFTLLGSTLNTGATATLIWANTNLGATWQYAGSDGASIINQSTTNQTADFRITGTGRANTSFISPLVDAIGAGTLGVGTATTGNLTVGNITAGGSNITTIQAATGGVSVVTAVSSGGGNTGNISLQTGNNASGSNNTSGSVSIKTGDASGGNASSGGVSIDVGAKTGSGTAGSITIGTGTNSAAAITIAKVGVGTTIQGNLTVGASAGSGTVFTNNGATVNTVLAKTDFAAGGSIGTAATTVDVYTAISIAQTTASQTVTIPAPTASTTYGRLLYLSNIGSVSFSFSNAGLTAPLAAGTSSTLIWSNTNGAASWQYAGADGNGILNQNTAIQTANFRISSVGQAAGFDINTTGTLNIGAGTTAGQLATTIQIGNAANNPAINLTSGTGTISIGTGAQNRTVDIATGGAVQTLTLGSVNTTSTTTIRGGVNGATEALSLQVGSTGVIGIGTTAASTLNIGTGAFAHTIAIGTNNTATQGISIGSTSASSLTTIYGGTTAGSGGISLQPGTLGTITLGASAGSGSTLINNGSTVNSVLSSLGDFPSGGAIGTAANTVDKYTYIAVPQTTANQTLTIPTPTANTTYGRIIYITNTGTTSFTMLGSTLNAGSTATLVWANVNGTPVWTYAGADGNAILNQTGSNQTANFQITGTGRASGFDINTTGTLNIGAGTTAGQLATAIQLGNDTNNSALTLSSGTGAINIGTGAQARTVNIATSGAVQSLNLGSANTSSTTIINTGTGGLSLGDNANSKTTNIGGVTNNGADTVNIATNATSADTVTIGSTNAGSIATFNGGAYNLNIRNTGVGINATAPTSGTVDLFFGAGARNVSVNQSAASTAGGSLTINAGKSGSGAFNGGDLVLQAGATGGSGVTGSVTVAANGTDSSTVFQVQNASGATALSIDTTNSAVNLAINGGAETSGTFATNWAAFGTGTTVTRTTTAGEFISGTAATKVVATTSANSGVINNLGAALTPTTTYVVSFSAKLASGGTPSTFTDLDVRYNRTGVTQDALCTTGSAQSSGTSTMSTRTLSTSTWTKITCTFVTSVTAGASDASLAIIQTAAATTRTFYIDNLSIAAQNSTGTQNTNILRVGGASSQGLTLLTLDTYAGTPFTGANAALAGSIYYDTTTAKIQCYDGTVWGACGAAPNSNVTLTPEYAGAVLNGTGIGTLTSDFCGVGGGLNINPSFCANGEARNFYKWTSVQPSAQGYSIFVTYKLPSTFKNFVSGTTTLSGRADNNTNGIVAYKILKSTGTAITSCSASTNVIGGGSGTINTWLSQAPSTDPQTCTFAPNNYVVFEIDVTASNSANTYVENLNFSYTNQ